MELAGEHWQMLLWSLVLFSYVYPAQRHYVPSGVWQELLRRFHQALDASDSSLRFRGSLVDEKMFAIDVNEWRLDNILEETRRLRLSKIKRKMRA
jgi:hypothetical protein